MGNRKDKSIGMRLLSSIASFLLIGSIVYIFVTGVNLYSGIVLASAVLGLGIPSFSAGEGLLEMMGGFFELFFEGLMEVVGGMFEAISSIFG